MKTSLISPDTAETVNDWYHNTKPDARQGLVADATTGRTVAIAYDPKDTALLAAAPALLAALEAIAEVSRLDVSLSSGEKRYYITAEEISAARRAISNAKKEIK